MAGLRVIVHVHNEDPFVAEVDKLPDPSDNFVTLRNPRKKDGKALTYVSDGATAFLFPWARITFIELIDGPSEREGQEDIVNFFREDRRRAGN